MVTTTMLGETKFSFDGDAAYAEREKIIYAITKDDIESYRRVSNDTEHLVAFIELYIIKGFTYREN